MFLYILYTNVNICLSLWPAWKFLSFFIIIIISAGKISYLSFIAFILCDLCLPHKDCFVRLPLSYWTTPLSLCYQVTGLGLVNLRTNSWILFYANKIPPPKKKSLKKSNENVNVFQENETRLCCSYTTPVCLETSLNPSGVSVVWSHCSAWAPPLCGVVSCYYVIIILFPYWHWTGKPRPLSELPDTCECKRAVLFPVCGLWSPQLQ